jgi:HAD superfamily hydrolase (TIGR01549 family)
MIKLISLDLWDTLITDGGKMEQERDSKRADFILKTLNLPETDKEKIMGFFRELVHSFKNPSRENKWAILPETQLQYLFKKLNVEPADEQFDEILKVYEEEALNNPPSLTEPDLRETLENLKKHYKLALISNTGRVPGKILQKILKEEGLLCFFDVLTFSDEVRMRKPDKDIFLLTCERACVEPGETIHVGDSVNIDFNGAQNAKVHPLLYVKYPKKPDREPYIRSIKEIKEAIRKFYDKN